MTAFKLFLAAIILAVLGLWPLAGIAGILMLVAIWTGHD